jgi:hypothetical protein
MILNRKHPDMREMTIFVTVQTALKASAKLAQDPQSSAGILPAVPSVSSPSARRSLFLRQNIPYLEYTQHTRE